MYALFLDVFQSVCLSVCLSVSLSVCLSIYLSICMSKVIIYIKFVSIKSLLCLGTNIFAHIAYLIGDSGKDMVL